MLPTLLGKNCHLEMSFCHDLRTLKCILWQLQQVLLPTLHIKLGRMKNFVKGMDKDGEEFKYLQGKFLALSEAKLRASIFTDPQIKKLLKDGDFEKSL